MSFTQKLINVTFTSGNGGFSPIAISGLRITCHALVAGENSMASCDLLIYGMTLSHMNQLSTLGWASGKPGNDMVQVYAGDNVGGMSLVYQGTIWQAVSDFQGGPNLPFHVVAQAGSRESALNIKPTSINNKSADFVQIWNQLAGQMGLQPETNGINVKLAYPYLPYSAREQAATLAQHAGVYWAIDRGVLAAWPQNGNRQGAAPLISPQTGMVGYPSWSSYGIKVKTLFNNQLQIGGQVQIQSSITPANGMWVIDRIEQNLQCLTPNGEWFTTFEAHSPTKGGGAVSQG
jgi:hypothetical protein